ncbi:MAG: type II toxin-antitoxin system RelE/ParE family toxin [Methylobacterium sp.]|nr:type II toxin-antitoxin system RelE/ParE family toxin [Methylobacterium sp.]MCA3608629.1 type II toxin-antitoxin system RelE/ParE family toxin [Methylobacterium sp.]MCA3618726.1 type II toxin-antitoxin system RelE/ParE family toxin [Methylobacterium sp.]MCA3621289.1 type II toxin-antitoxin system RelE/ParE family toxin [Methylobacterium sp.]
MTYSLAFLAPALKEWKELDEQTRAQFKAKLRERLDNPHVPAARLSGSANRCKIKLRAAGWRLVYEVRDNEMLVVVIVVCKRDKDAVYRAAKGREGVPGR